MLDDVDWQSVANDKARIKKDGSPDVKTAHITDQVPFGGHYRYKTNPNMTGNWLIGGEIKVNKILTSKEVKDINDKAGVSDLPKLSDLGLKFNKGGIVPMELQQQTQRLSCKKEEMLTEQVLCLYLSLLKKKKKSLNN